MDNKPAVLHFALQPMTGVVSVIRQLAKAQSGSALFSGVSIGVIHDDTWPDYYRHDLKNIGMPFYSGKVPKLPGTLQFLWQSFKKGVLENWVRDFAAIAHTDTVILHCHNAWMSGVFLPLQTIKNIKTLFVATFHGVNSHFENKPLRRMIHACWANRLLRHDAKLTSVDSDNPDVARRILRMRNAEFTVIPNGAPFSLSRGVHYPNHRSFLLVAHVGSISESKGWKLTADAVLSAVRNGRNMRMVIAGTGPQEDEARQYATKYPKVIEYLGHVDDPAENLMPDIDVLSVMSRREGLPMTIIEAMAAAVPVVATSVGGIPMAVKNEDTGYLIPRTINDLSQKLYKLYDEPKILQSMSIRTQAVFEEKFHINRIVKQYAEVYGLRKSK
jgi:glycosyltransferase involved in cell wall biosynthesis